MDTKRTDQPAFRATAVLARTRPHTPTFDETRRDDTPPPVTCDDNPPDSRTNMGGRRLRSHLFFPPQQCTCRACVHYMPDSVLCRYVAPDLQPVNHPAARHRLLPGRAGACSSGLQLPKPKKNKMVMCLCLACVLKRAAGPFFFFRDLVFGADGWAGRARTARCFGGLGFVVCVCVCLCLVRRGSESDNRPRIDVNPPQGEMQFATFSLLVLSVPSVCPAPDQEPAAREATQSGVLGEVGWGGGAGSSNFGTD